MCECANDWMRKWLKAVRSATGGQAFGLRKNSLMFSKKNTLLYTKKQKHLCSVPPNEGRAEVTHDIMDINKTIEM